MVKPCAHVSQDASKDINWRQCFLYESGGKPEIGK